MLVFGQQALWVQDLADEEEGIQCGANRRGLKQVEVGVPVAEVIHKAAPASRPFIVGRSSMSVWSRTRCAR
jgi:hypothetical protein